MSVFGQRGQGFFGFPTGVRGEETPVPTEFVGIGAACPCPLDPTQTVILGSNGQGHAARLPTRFFFIEQY